MEQNIDRKGVCGPFPPRKDCWRIQSGAARRGVATHRDSSRWNSGGEKKGMASATRGCSAGR